MILQDRAIQMAQEIKELPEVTEEALAVAILIHLREAVEEAVEREKQVKP